MPIVTDADEFGVSKAASSFLACCSSGNGKFLPIALRPRVVLSRTTHWANVLLFGPGQYLYLLMNG